MALLDLLSGELPRSFAFIIAHNLAALVGRLSSNVLTRIVSGFCRRVRIRTLGKLGDIILLYQGPDPVFPASAKVIWETYFLPPQSGEPGFDEPFCRGCNNSWMQRMENYGSRAFKIGVRGEGSVALVRKFFPELSGKVVDLGFVHQEYQVLSEEDVVKKQLECHSVKILFVGRLARLKGLAQLVDALKIVRQCGVTNFTLTVVSMMRDGIVPMPIHEGWIEYYKELDHQHVMELFRKAHIFAMPSYKDSYGLVFHEALASGCVTCVPDRDPQREFVDFGRAGVVLDHFDVMAMADDLRTIILDSALRNRLAVAGLRRYNLLYSQSCIRESWRRVVNDAILLGKKGGGHD